jgi:hypothetical protein
VGSAGVGLGGAGVGVGGGLICLPEVYSASFFCFVGPGGSRRQFPLPFDHFQAPHVLDPAAAQRVQQPSAEGTGLCSA